MERVNLHFKLYVTSYIISSSVRIVDNIFMTCAQGQMQPTLKPFFFFCSFDFILI